MLRVKNSSRPFLRLQLTAALLRRPYSVVTDVPIPTKSKVWDNVHEAVKDVKDGDILLSGGAHTAKFLLIAIWYSQTLWQALDCVVFLRH